jgi:hypothetical protein
MTARVASFLRAPPGRFLIGDMRLIVAASPRNDGAINMRRILGKRRMGLWLTRRSAQPPPASSGPGVIKPILKIQL